MPKAVDRAYELIRTDILSGALRPGEQVREEALAEACGVSRTPVREAMRRLEAEHLIRRVAQRSFIAALSTDEVEEAFTLRAMLEGHAAARAAERISAPRLKALVKNVESAKILIGGAMPDIAGFLDHNREFHAIILQEAGSERLSGLLATIVEQPVILRTASHYGRDQLARSVAEHEELVEAFRHRDPEWARAVMAAHIRRAFHVFSETIQRIPDNDDAGA